MCACDNVRVCSNVCACVDMCEVCVYANDACHREEDEECTGVCERFGGIKRMGYCMLRLLSCKGFLPPVDRL
jgi:hypothetical protein